MNGTSVQDDSSFRRILARNITMPLVAGVVNVGVFAGILVYLLNVLTWVEHTERSIGNANEIAKLMVDQESGMRGFALTGDETFLASYKLAKPKMATGLAALREMVADNPVQVNRVRNIEAQQRQWDVFAQGVIDLRRKGGDYLEPIKAGRGKLEFDEVRNLFQLFVTSEQRLLAERRAHAKTVTRFAVTAFVLASLVVSGLLAMFGRRDMRKLSENYGKVLHEQTEHSERLQAQAWLRTGQTLLAEQGIGQMALPQLSSALLQFLSQYVGVAAAALYVREQDGSLRRTASYGYGQEEEEYGAVLATGQGLPWQAVQHRRVIQLDDLPEDYLKISSRWRRSTATASSTAWWSWPSSSR